MALPSLIERNNLQSEKQTMGILTEQKELLSRISQSIISNNKEFGSLRKDMSDLKKEFTLGMSAFDDLKKYLEDIKSEKLKTKTVESKDQNRSFFSAAIAKLLGKKESMDDVTISDLQRKILDETIVIKNLSLNTDENISVIRKSYEPAEKAKDRKLLAEAIANEMDGGGSTGKGFLGVITALGISLAALGTYLVKGIGEVVGNIVIKALQSLGLSKAVSTVAGPTPDLDKDKNKKPQPKTGGLRGFLGKVATGLGIAGTATLAATPSDLGDSTMDAYRERLKKQYEEGKFEQEIDAEVTRKQFEAFYGGNAKVMEEMKAAANQQDFMLEKVAELNRMATEGTQAGTETAQDIIQSMDEIALQTREEFLKQKGLLEDQTAQQQEKNQLEQEEIDTKSEDVDLYSLMTEKLKGVMDGLSDLTPEGTSKKIVEFLNNLGEIEFGNGQKLNLFPELGTSLASALDSMDKELADMKNGGALGQVNTVVNNSTSVGGNATTVFPDARTTSPDIDSYRSKRPIQ